MGEWIKGINIVGGRLFGETIPCSDSFPGYSVGDDGVVGWNGSGDDPKSQDITNFFLDVPYTTGLNDQHVLVAIFQGNDNYPLNKLAIEMDINSHQAWGRARLGLNVRFGYLNDSQTFVEVHGHANGQYSGEGVSDYSDLSLRLHVCYYTQNNRIVFGIASSIKSASRDCYAIGGTLCSQNWIQSYAPGASELPVTSPEFGKKAKKKGGYNPDHSRKGTFDDSSDKIEVSSKPGTSPFSTGFIHGYTVNRTQLAGFSQALFPTPPTSFSDIPGAIMGLVTTLLNNKKPDYILDFLIVPVVPNTGNEEVISLGGSYLQYADDQGAIHFVHGDPIDVNSCYVDHNCGSITIPEYWANFLDFSGTRFKLFLPYVGYVDIQPEYINGGNLKVWYRFNVFDGSFMCYVESTSGHSELDESLIAQYAGVAAVHIPVQARDYSNKISGLISAMGVVAAGSTGGISAAAGMGAAASTANTLVQKPGSSHANGYNASSSFLSHRKPYLIIERQSSQFSEKYPEERGLPLFIKTTIGQCRGLTVCDNPHLDTIPATVEEKEMIMKFLTDGIIV